MADGITKIIPVGKPSVSLFEIDSVVKSLLDGQVSGSGPIVQKFEQDWASLNNYKYGVACNSGTTALYLALLALGIGKGDEVIVPEFTMASTAWAVSYCGAKPIFVDCLDDLTMDPAIFKSKITNKTKAVMVVPIYGRPVSKHIYQLARDNNIFVVEDFAEAHGIKPKGDITCYSFQANKIITTGEGGMCLTNEKIVADEMRKLSSLYFDNTRSMIHERIGYNFRMTSLQAAFGVAQVKRFNELLEKRKNVADLYDKYIDERYKMPKREVVWVYDIKVKNPEEVKAYLMAMGVDSRYFFKPMSMQPMYLNDYKHLNAYKWSKSGLYLPTYADLSEEDIKYICRILNKLP